MYHPLAGLFVAAEAAYRSEQISRDFQRSQRRTARRHSKHTERGQQSIQLPRQRTTGTSDGAPQASDRSTDRHANAA